MILFEILFWFSVGAIAYTYIGYPIVIWGLSRFFPDPVAVTDPPGDPADWPFVSLVIAAYREERVILDRIHNALRLDYPADRFEILIGCDGNEDLTGELVSSVHDDRVRLMQFEERRGKASVLNDCISEARGEIIVLSDANTMFDSKAIRRLARRFRDVRVGAVCGQLILTDIATGTNADGIYWRYENFLKRCEARFGALLGVNGAIYAMRRRLYRPIPPETINDDFLIGMRVHVDQCHLLYDESAIAHEETASQPTGEFGRRARIGAGGFQSMAWLHKLLDPRQGRIAFTFWSHKVLRWLGPAFLLTALLSNIVLARDPSWLGTLLLQVAFYSAAVWGQRSLRAQRIPRVFRLPSMFVDLNVALAVGFFRWITGRQKPAWERTVRSQEQDERKVTA